MTKISILLFYKISALSIFLFFANYTHSQNSSYNPLLSDYSQIFYTKNAYSFNSNSIRNDIILKYWNSESIDSKTKDNSINNLKNNNYFGGSAHADIFFSTIKEKSTIGYIFSSGARTIIDCRFNPNYFKLFINGNTQFSGEKINLEDFNFQLLQYQFLKAGFYIKKHAKESQHISGASISFINGYNHLSIDCRNSTIYTDEKGLEIDISSNVNIKASAKETTPTPFKGTGFSFDFFSLHKGKNNQFSIEIRNAGYIKWNINSYQLDFETSINFDGVNIGNVLKNSSENIENAIIDSIITLSNYKPVINSYKSIMPCFIYTSYTHYVSPDKFFLQAEFQHILFTNYRPLLQIRPSISIVKQFWLSSPISYGGYGNFNTGIGISYTNDNGLSVFTGSNNLLGYFTPSELSGQNFFLNLAYAF